MSKICHFRPNPTPGMPDYVIYKEYPKYIGHFLLEFLYKKFQ